MCEQYHVVLAAKVSLAFFQQNFLSAICQGVWWGGVGNWGVLRTYRGQGSSVEPMALVVASPRSALTKATGWPLSHWGGGCQFWRWKSNVFLK